MYEKGDVITVEYTVDHATINNVVCKSIIFQDAFVEIPVTKVKSHFKPITIGCTVSYVGPSGRSWLLKVIGLHDGYVWGECEEMGPRMITVPRSACKRVS